MTKECHSDSSPGSPYDPEFTRWILPAEQERRSAGGYSEAVLPTFHLKTPYQVNLTFMLSAM